MNKAKGLSIIAMTLLIFQLFSPNLGIVAGTQKDQEVGKEDSGKVTVKAVSHDENSITWSIVINDLKIETDGITTNVLFGEGLTHSKIKTSDDVKREEHAAGYTLTTPSGTDTYNVELTTQVSEGQDQFELKAEADYGEGVYKAVGSVELDLDTDVDENVSDENGVHEDETKNQKVNDKGKGSSST